MTNTTRSPKLPVSAMTSATVTVVIRGAAPPAVLTAVLGERVDTITGTDVVTSVHIGAKCQRCYAELARNKHF